MKKSTKIILFMAMVFLCLGIVFTTIGAVMGGNRRSLKYYIGNGRGSLTNTKYDDFDNIDYTLMESFDGDDIDNISININVSALKIKLSDDNKCNFYVEEGNDREILAELDNGSLDIWDKDRDNFKYFGIGIFKNVDGVYAILELPEKKYKNLEATADLGCIFGEDINVSGTCSFNVDLGHIKMKNVDCSELFLNCDLGNIDAEKITSSYAEIYCDLGNIDAEKINADNSIISCNMGNITLNYIGNSNNYLISTNSEMGKISIDKSKHTKEQSVQNKKIEIDCDMGNVNVNFEE